MGRKVGYSKASIGKGTFDKMYQMMVSANGFDAQGLTAYSSKYSVIGAMNLVIGNTKKVAILSGHKTAVVEAYIQMEQLEQERYNLLQNYHNYLRFGKTGDNYQTMLHGTCIGSGYDCKEDDDEKLDNLNETNVVKPLSSNLRQNEGRETNFFALSQNQNQLPLPEFSLNLPDLQSIVLDPEPVKDMQQKPAVKKKDNENEEVERDQGFIVNQNVKERQFQKKNWDKKRLREFLDKKHKEAKARRKRYLESVNRELSAQKYDLEKVHKEELYHQQQNYERQITEIKNTYNSKISLLNIRMINQHDRHNDEMKQLRETSTKYLDSIQDLKLKLYSVQKQLEQQEKLNINTISKAQVIDMKDKDDTTNDGDPETTDISAISTSNNDDQSSVQSAVDLAPIIDGSESDKKHIHIHIHTK